MASASEDKRYERELARAREAKARFSDELMGIPGVHGIGIGYKRAAGKQTNQLAVVVHVSHKRPKSEVRPAELIPAVLRLQSEDEGREIRVVTDVREAAPPSPEVDCPDCDVNFGQRVRPVPGGYSIGLATQPGGTLGGWFWDNLNDRVVLLSNHHVLGGAAGATVIQPSIGDGGSSPADDVGEVVRAGTLDASIARFTDSDDVQAEVECSTGAVFEVANAAIGMEVEKVGQTTGLTCGVVELIDYDSGHYGSKADLWIDGDGANFSEAGDSGSLYVEKTHPEGRTWKRIIGIHWGGSGNDGVGHPIVAVMRDLSLVTICAGIINAILESIVFGRRVEAEDEVERSAFLEQPWTRRDWRRAGLARDLEKRFLQTPTGSTIHSLLHEYRVSVIKVLLTGDGRRAALAFLGPILRKAVTTDDVLEHRVGAEDLENTARLLKVARRAAPEAERAIKYAEELMQVSDGRTIGEVLGGEKAARTSATPNLDRGQPASTIRARGQ